jgi:ketopantoate reductase
MINKIYISGLGAIGSAYAAKLYEMDPQCIKIIASRERIESYQKEGVRVNEKLYSFEYVIPAVVGTQTKVPDVQKADLIIVAVKYHLFNVTEKDIRIKLEYRRKIISVRFQIPVVYKTSEYFALLLQHPPVRIITACF